MLLELIKKIFGTKHEREMKRLWPRVHEINALAQKFQTLADEDFPKKTEEFYKRYQDGESLDSILPEAYALVKEACRRFCGKSWLVRGIETTWNMVPFDVQIIGAIVLHEGKIAEMKTGEGKTLVATMPLYLNGLTKRGVHLVTVNDYLAARDREWMGPIYEFLGLTVGCIQQGMEPQERKREYNCDITYGTNNEFGFDYLRDNMVVNWEDKVQRGHYYAIIDEVDSILIDEARTPLIISGPVEASDRGFDKLTPIVRRLYQTQNIFINRLVDEAERLLKENRLREAGIKLLQARRGAPKNKRLMKLEQEEGVKRLIERTELEFLRDKKLHEIDRELYFVIDEKNNTIDLTDKGRKEAFPQDPDFFTLPDLSGELARITNDPNLTPKEKLYEKEKAYRKYAEKSELIHNFHALLKAFSLFERDVDYIVQDNKVIIVDEFTGRLMPGRRFSDGLHQALEAKEGVRVQEETQTLATITIQNYFRMYEKLAGMTGTALTNAQEFYEVYKLDVIEIPTNQPIRRIDYPDVIYKTRREKYNAVINEIERWHKQGRPILVGTTSVEVSETLSRLLKRRGINHEVLNAKYHQKEAEIVAQAGKKGAVTIATNMAGRGTDIKLEPGVIKGEVCYINTPGGGKCAYWEEHGGCLEDVPCGLYIIGTERHEARRIDNQLRGRSGRQGDPGSSRFFLSLEDDLMRLFGSDRIASLMDRLGVKEMEPIQNPLVSKAIENAQKRVEARNFEIRKHLLEYDDVMNKQREVVYHLRDQILKGENLEDIYYQSVDELISQLLNKYANSKNPEEWDWESLRGEFGVIFLADFTVNENEISKMKPEVLKDALRKIAENRLAERKAELGEEIFKTLAKAVFLRIIDAKWRDHLYALDILREGVGLVAYGQKDPLIEYKQESFKMFNEMMGEFYRDSVSLLLRAQVELPKEKRVVRPAYAYKPEITSVGLEESNKKESSKLIQPQQISSPKIGRNDPCPCGSGKKYKKCCGATK
ncbi:MAG: preprotein translocase subunit SecA [candidate division WOR-3 bacterium]|nr:preprotein translocase subunit SecA [candidate division WOR-3 bacterium]MDW7987703.1 preprotein translocase subunit SecA [candidate division WOR-3 bacterium]